MSLLTGSAPITHRKIILFSGGLDSLIAWDLTGRRLPAVYYAIGHRYQDMEVETIQRLTDNIPNLHVVIQYTLDLGEQEYKDGHIPYRNLLLASMAAAEADSHHQPLDIYLGALRGEVSRDKSRRFFREITRLLSYTEGKRVRVIAPFVKYTKTQLVEEYLRRHGKQHTDELRMTRSCYGMNEYDEQIVGCGECQACFRRWVAMYLNGIDETYASPPHLWEPVRDMHRAWHYLKRSSIREWPSILRNNYDAWLALNNKKASK